MKAESKATTAIILDVTRVMKKRATAGNTQSKEKKETTTDIAQDKSDDLHPVKLRVTFRRQRKYYTLPDTKGQSQHLTKGKFEKIMGKAPREQYKETRLHLNAIETKAQSVIKKLPYFTFEGFEAAFFNNADTGNVFTSLENKAAALKKEGRISTAVTFQCALKSLQSFHTKKNLSFEQITVSFLKSYESWMIKAGNSYTTIGIYLRSIRAAYNEARAAGILKEVPYPFGKKGYQIPTGTNVKKALRQAEIAKIKNYSPVPGTNDEKLRDFWLFSYLCNGINVKDMARLKYKNIDGDMIRLVRAKTERETRKNPRPIEIVITRQVGRIIDRWGNKPAAPDNYLLPILEPGMTPETEYRRIQDTIKRINKTMNQISESLELPMKVTTYTARHSFATVLKRSGASAEFISESLGHTNLQTTENYLDKFETDEKREWAEKL
jgi:integrase